MMSEAYTPPASYPEAVTRAVLAGVLSYREAAYLLDEAVRQLMERHGDEAAVVRYLLTTRALPPVVAREVGG